MATINIDPTKAGDQFYRYKMPKLNAKQESGGNGAKTVLVNLDAISEKLARDPGVVSHYLKTKLAVNEKYMANRWILTGHQDQSNLEKILFGFITSFVLCQDCRNPETTLVLEQKKGKVLLDCKACSRVTQVNPREDITINFILMEEKNREIRLKQQGAAKGGKGGNKSKDQEEEEAIAASTREAREDDSIITAPIEQRPPVEVLKEFYRDNELDDFPSKVFEIKNEYGLEDEDVVALVFESLFDASIVAQIPKRGKILKRFIPMGLEGEVITNLVLLCQELGHKEGAEEQSKNFMMSLKAFYDNEVISSEAITEWHGGEKTKVLGCKKATVRRYKEWAQPIVDWLNLESDDEDEEGEEEEGEEED